MNIENPGLFIVPHFAKKGDVNAKKFLSEAIEGIQGQTDGNWECCIVDDASTNEDSIQFLQDIEKQYSDKFKILFLKQNFGPGVLRNIGISMAKQRRNPFVMFNDADDISHPDRLKVTRDILKNNPEVGLVYSSFIVIDEDNAVRPKSEIPLSIMEICKNYENNGLLEGEDVWIKMAIDTGYLNKTSSTSILTSHAVKCLFPNARASEDFNTWMRISAKGAIFKYVKNIESRYRVPKYLKYQNSRSLLGNNNFNKHKVQMDAQGFEHSIDIALSREKIDMNDANKLRNSFYTRLAKTMKIEGELELEKSLLKKAEECRKILTLQEGFEL